MVADLRHHLVQTVTYQTRLDEFVGTGDAPWLDVYLDLAFLVEKKSFPKISN